MIFTYAVIREVNISSEILIENKYWLTEIRNENSMVIEKRLRNYSINKRHRYLIHYAYFINKHNMYIEANEI